MTPKHETSQKVTLYLRRQHELKKRDNDIETLKKLTIKLYHIPLESKTTLSLT